MIDERFVFLGFAIAMVGATAYIRGILRGAVRPNVVTWSLWATAPMIAVIAQLSEGAGLRAVHTFSTAFGPMLIVITALIKRNAFAKIKKSDYIFGILSMMGLVLWYVTGEGVIAIIFAILADGFAASPTVRKLYAEPDTEDGRIFGLGILAAVISLLTITNWQFEQYGFALYIVIINSIMFFPTLKKWLTLKGVSR
jgi:hypothetical protein